MEKDIIKQIIKDYKFEQIGLDEAVDKICALAEDSIETRNCNISDVMQQSELLLAFCKENHLKFNLNNAEQAQKLIDAFLRQ